MHRSVLVVVALAVSLVLAGCSPGGVDESPGSPSPSASVPAPPSSVNAETEALYAEAEYVFLQSMEFRYRFERDGDYTSFPEELGDLLADPFLASVRQLYDYGQQHGLHGQAGTQPKLAIRPYPGASKDGSEVALRVCLDTTEAPALDADGQVFSEGGLFFMELFFKHVDGRLKLFSGTTTEIEQCPFD